jgi:Tfp pilus assembly protein FimT
MKSNAKKIATRPVGFTLIELVVVMGIIVLVLALALPAFNKLMQGNNIKQATNMATAYITSGRAAALQQKRSVAVVFYEESAGQTAVVLAREVAVDATNGNVSYFEILPGRYAEYLPAGVKVATLNGAGTLQTEAVGATAAGCRAIVFDPNGQVVMRNGLGGSSGIGPSTVAAWAAATAYTAAQTALYNGTVYTCLVGNTNQIPPQSPTYWSPGAQPYSAATAYAANMMCTSGGVTYISLQSANTGNTPGTSPAFWATWNFNATPANIATDLSFSTPGVLVYDGTDFSTWVNNQSPAPTAAAVSTWLQQHGDVLIVNIYTGNVVR